MWGLGIRELSSTGMGSGVGGCRVSGLDMASGTKTLERCFWILSFVNVLYSPLQPATDPKP